MLAFRFMSVNEFDLFVSARQEMLDEGFHPDFPRGVPEQLASLLAARALSADPGVRDLRSLLWSSIDNDTSRDLDQAEVAERVAGGIRLRIAIADVDSDVPLDSPIDRHAREETTSVYT
ncbi:MAG TPA: RNB domain-containing ribonuclease, partial [Bryobacteraceae bacterium]|nr:RNB domain-containing ribonuclease [Bryobacteraceae bacterium]